jgi:D-Tyr-tRNAtyr deacylase
MVLRAFEQLGLPVQSGRFGATMAVFRVNDGPRTIRLESP